MVDNGGRTALHWACTSAQVDIVKDLLEMNAQVNIKDNCGWTPLHSAASVGHDEIILLLLDKGCYKLGCPREKTTIFRSKCECKNRQWPSSHALCGQ